MPIERFRHDTMTGREFGDAMAALTLNDAEFSRITGTREKTLERWKEDGPPYWVTSLFACLKVTGIRQLLRETANAHLMSEDEWKAAREEFEG